MAPQKCCAQISSRYKKRHTEDKTKEELEEETFAAVHSYLTARDNEERYPLSYSKDQKRELR